MATKQTGAGDEVIVVSSPPEGEVEVISVCVQVGDRVRKGSVLCQYQPRNGSGTMQSLKSPTVGIVRRVITSNGDIAAPKSEVVTIEEHCDHSVVAFDLCAICGANLKCSEQGMSEAASVSMLHAIPQVRISQKEAALLGNKDKQRMLSSRKLALVVDLDQTLIHTSVDPHIEPGLPDVYQFSLPGHRHVYHCRLRPSAREFLFAVSQLYEMHVFTMGTKDYAVAVTRILDPERKLFSDRVISRDECFDPHSKALRLRSVFPCGDEMVAIIDDREDIWGRCANLVHVKPYIFFAGTADINSPPSSHRRDSRQPQASHSRPFEIRPQQQGFVQTVTHENKVDVTDNSNNNNNTSDKEDERSRGKEDEENESSSSSSSDSSSSDTDSSSSEEESEGDTAKQQASTAGIEDCQTSGSSPIALEKHPSGQEETATAHTVPDTNTIQPVSDTHTTKPEPGTGLRTKIEDPDKFLLSLERILQRVHAIFYTEYDSVQQTNTHGKMDRRGSCGDDIPTPDLKVIIPRFRKSVLEGARLVFTGVIPTNMPIERSREWNTARAFGAVVQPQLISGKGKAEITSEATTHLIVGRPGTNKHRQALKMKGLKVVNSKWLWACAEQWEWVDETSFAPDFPPEVATKPAKEKKEVEVKEQTKTHQIEEESPSKGSSDPPVSISVGAGSSRHRSHRFSVSSEELEKMEAEINRELSIEEEDDDESEEEEEDRLGSYIGDDNQTESMDTSEQYLGLETNSSELSRKRKYDEVEISSSNSNSPEDHSQSVRVSEDEEDDELADLLGL